MNTRDINRLIKVRGYLLEASDSLTRINQGDLDCDEVAKIERLKASLKVTEWNINEIIR